MSVKTVSVLGSTGSIGQSTVDLLLRNPEKYKVVALTGNKNLSKLVEQAKMLNAEIVATADKDGYAELKRLTDGMNITVLAGNEGVLQAASADADWTMCSIVGAAGLMPTVEAVKRGKTIALANKETLVCAGKLVLKAIDKYGACLLPVDSEHGAIFQCLEQNQRSMIDHLILTASGGPFRDKTKEFMQTVTPEQAVAHPNWSMGAKISVDSASMMNKGLEIIEAYHLFGFPADKIEVVVHPQSIVHSAVAYKDGSVLAQMGCPDMRTPIAYALGYPDRIEAPTQKLDLTALSGLTFSHPDEDKFPALRLAKQALNMGDGMTALMNAANEEAVYAFLNREIGFMDMMNIVERMMDKGFDGCIQDFNDVLSLDAQTRIKTKEMIKEMK